MITINKTATSLNLDIPVDGIYGFAMDGAVCFVSDDGNCLTTVWDSIGVEVDNINSCETIGDIIEWTKVCKPEDIIKILYSQHDFNIVVDV